MHSEEHHDHEFVSALKVQEGIEALPQVNQNFLEKYKSKKQSLLSVDEYVQGITSGNRVLLSKAITLIESTLHEHQEISQKIIEKCLPYAGKSIRVGITGVPGAGKSTFIEAMGTFLTKEKGKQLAVLAIDPSSERSKGSILGDKTRMEELSVDPNAFIRPSPSAGSLGGVARKTREIIILCEACGFDTIFVETVGVGQSEIAVHSMVDFFLLIQLANTGDELQGIKRGIMEMADAITINKADGDNIHKAQLAKTQFQNALHLFPPTDSGWIPPVLTCSAYTKDGIPELWDVIMNYKQQTQASGYFYHKRQTQSVRILTEWIEHSLKENFYDHPSILELIPKIQEAIFANKISPYAGAQELLNIYFSKK